MMNCSCRTTALRLFVRNVTSVHVPADFAARQAARCQSLPTSLPKGFSTLNGRTAGALRGLPQSKSLHTTSANYSTEATTKDDDVSVGQKEHAEPSATNNGGASGNVESESTSEAPQLPARKLRKIRRMEEKKKLKQEARAQREANPDPKPAKRERTFKTSKRETRPRAARGERTPRAAQGERQKPRMAKRERAPREEGVNISALKEELKAQSEEDPTTPKIRGKKERSKREEKPWEKEKREKEERQRRRDKEHWMLQKEALKEKFPEGWAPRKKMSPDAMAGIRALHREFPDMYTTEVLAAKFEMSPEAIRRILKSKWEEKDQTPDIEIERQDRWFKRGKSVWTRWAELGKKPPVRWRAEGIVRDPVWNVPRGVVHPQHLKKREKREDSLQKREERRATLAAQKLSESLM